MHREKGTLSERIRKVAAKEYVVPAREAGAHIVEIPIRDMMAKFMPGDANGRQSVFCSALEARRFWEPQGLHLDRRDGPPSGRGASVTFYYRWKEAGAAPAASDKPMTQQEADSLADLFLGPLQGLLAKEIKEIGGTEAFIRWVRSEEPTR